MNRLIKCFTILTKYCSEGEGWDVAVCDKTIYCGGPDPDKLSKEDAKELTKQGFNHTKEYGWVCFVW